MTSIWKYCLAVFFFLLGASAQEAVSQTLFGSSGSQDQRENAVNIDWAYNWGNAPKHDVAAANYEFVPMIWSGNPTGVLSQINTIKNLEANYGVEVDYVLGFNEPELSTQANMTVESAINTWEVISQSFDGTGVKLVSPAVSGNGALNDWLAPFMSEVASRNADSNTSNDLQVDAIAYHFYTVGYNATTEANKLITQLDKIWADYQRPIWLTEFAGTSFSLDNPIHSVEERTAFNAEFLDVLLPAFESRDFVERVAWWQFGALGKPYSALTSAQNGVYTPTELGEIYSRTTLAEGASYDLTVGDTKPTDVHYLKGGELTNSGAEQQVALRAIDALEGDSVFGGTGDFGFENADDAFLRVRSGATLRKQGANEVTLPGSLVDVSGTLLVEQGTVQFKDGAQVTGAGTIRVNRNGTLALSKSSDQAEAVHVSQDTEIILNQGEMHVKDGRAVIDGQVRFWNESVVRTDGDLLINGNTTGYNRLVSSGAGNLFLTGVGERTLGTTVNEGGLYVANTEASATGAAEVLVTGTGTFGGFGQVGGNVLVEAGGTVNPGVSKGSHGVTSAVNFTEGVVVDAIDFDFSGVQDDAPLTHTSTLSSALRLVSGLDFGPGVNPRGASNNGNEFNVAGFSTESTWGGASTGEDYLTYTVAPVDGLAMKIDDATFELRRNGGGAATDYRIFTSVDGFDAWNAGLQPLTLTLDSADTNTHEFTASYQGTDAVTGPVEVRLYGWGASSGAGNTHIYGASLDASFISDPDSVVFDPTGVLQLGGDYTQLDFATLAINLGGTGSDQFDQLLVNGNVSLDGILDLSFTDGFAWNIGDTFDIITANAITGEFDTVLAPDGWFADVTYADTYVRIQAVSAVPEPASIAMLSLGGVYLLRRRRRQTV
ncbi:MAG: glycosyl hydrolase [Rubripirellula sp.]